MNSQDGLHPPSDHPGRGSGANDPDRAAMSLEDATAAIEVLPEGVLVADLMTASPFTVRPDATLADVSELFVERRIRHAPVLDAKGELVGLITQRDLFRATGPLCVLEPSGLLAMEVMATRLDTILAHASASDAAAHMLATKRGCLPVIEEDGTLVGILTEADFLRAFVRGL